MKTNEMSIDLLKLAIQLRLHNINALKGLKKCVPAPPPLDPWYRKTFLQPSLRIVNILL